MMLIKPHTGSSLPDVAILIHCSSRDGTQRLNCLEKNHEAFKSKNGKYLTKTKITENMLKVNNENYAVKQSIKFSLQNGHKLKITMI